MFPAQIGATNSVWRCRPKVFAGGSMCRDAWSFGTMTNMMHEQCGVVHLRPRVMHLDGNERRRGDLARDIPYTLPSSVQSHLFWPCEIDPIFEENERDVDPFRYVSGIPPLWHDQCMWAPPQHLFRPSLQGSAPRSQHLTRGDLNVH